MMHFAARIDADKSGAKMIEIGIENEKFCI